MKKVLIILGISVILAVLFNYQYNVSAKNPELYIGKWKVERVVEFAKISGIDDDEIELILGKKLILSEKKVQFGKLSLKNPYYRKYNINNDEFMENSGFRTLDNIGIKKERVDKVLIFTENSEDCKYLWHKFGCVSYVKDKNTLIVDYKGAYFELKRIK